MTKRKLKKGARITVFILLAAVCTAGYFLLSSFIRQKAYDALSMTVDESMLKAEYGSPWDISAFVTQVNADTSEVSGTVDTHATGTRKLVYTLSGKDAFGRKVTREYAYDIAVEDTSAPEITLAQDTVTVMAGEPYNAMTNLISVIDPTDGSLSEGEGKGCYSVTGDLNTDAAGDYTINVHAEDLNGLTADRSFTVKVLNVPDAEYPFYIKINRELNTVTVYMMDQNGQYTLPVKAMVCSTGTYTMLGVYQTPSKYRWLPLYGGVYGQYATRIHKSILFHSVPYFSQNPGDLEYEEYNKLGTSASLGCIRLCVRDAKWIFDNCPVGTTVELYDDANDPGPLGKPVPLTIDINSENRGWDPTDPDPGNPWSTVGS